ncbi:hypothetical protein HZH66_008205 [Vespula vulgaris]|uniref:Uncharacterized protein n=1 Tax=Vespula vulgaris TaxID=7454 RepID=A0A834JV73_VESVU|nr:hypothetical protein HZH66_008205 [Vespula vulgaris]
MSTRCISRHVNGLVNDRTTMHESKRVNWHVSNAILCLASEQPLANSTIGSIFFDRLKCVGVNEIFISEKSRFMVRRSNILFLGYSDIIGKRPGRCTVILNGPRSKCRRHNGYDEGTEGSERSGGGGEGG